MAITALCSMLKPATEKDPSHCQFSAQPNHLVSMKNSVSAVYKVSQSESTKNIRNIVTRY